MMRGQKHQDEGRQLEVVLSGGAPWGIMLGGGDGQGLPLFIADLQPGSRAGRGGAVQVLDQLLTVNSTPVRSQHHAVQLIRTATHTLTLRVRRGGSGQPPDGATPTGASSSREHLKEALRSVQDDSVVYAESKNKSSVRRPKRRGASFNLKKRDSDSQPSAWQQPDVREEKWRNDRPSEPPDAHGYGAAHQRASATFQDFVSSPDLAERAQPSPAEPRMYEGSRSMSNLQYFTQNSGGDPWGSNQSHAKNTGHLGAPPSESRMKKSFSYAAPHAGSAWDRSVDPAYHVNSNKENKVRSGSMQNLGQGHNDGLQQTYAWSSSRQNVPTTQQSDIQKPYGYSRSTSEENRSVYPFSSDSGYPVKEPPAVVVDMKDNLGSAHHFPEPPVRDASSLKYIKVSQSHEKYPSWPVTSSNTVLPHDRDPGINSRTNSWSDNTVNVGEFPAKPIMAYHPQLNTHTEERLSPSSARQYFHENGVRSAKDRRDMHMEVVSKLHGLDVDIKKTFPRNSNGQIDVDRIKSNELSYPMPNYDKDGRLKEDKDYKIPTPPERDLCEVMSSPYTHKDPNGRSSLGYPPLSETSLPEAHPYSPKDPNRNSLGFTPDGVRSSQGYPPLPETSPPEAHPPVTAQLYMNSSLGIPAGGQTILVRSTRPYYNTGTQTEVPQEVNGGQGVVDSGSQVTEDAAGMRRHRADASCQARYQSIVGHTYHESTGNDYEPLRFERPSSSESEPKSVSSTEVQTSGISTATSPLSAPPAAPWESPGVSMTTGGSPAGVGGVTPHRTPLTDRMEQGHRIPETIRENVEVSGTGNTPLSHRQHTVQQDMLQHIQDSAPSQTSMLRKLSQEFFGAKIGVARPNSRSSVGGSSSEPLRARHPSSDPPPQSPPVAGESEAEDTLQPLPFEDTKSKEEIADNIAYFDRKKNMSLKKAYGIFDEVENYDTKRGRRKLMNHGKSASTSQVAAPAGLVVPGGRQGSHESVVKARSGPDMSEGWADKSRVKKEHVVNLKPVIPADGRLKRATSEQLRPIRERRIEETDLDAPYLKPVPDNKHKLSDPEANQEKRHKTVQQAQPSQFLYPDPGDIIHGQHRNSDPFCESHRDTAARPMSDPESMSSSLVMMDTGFAASSGAQHARSASNSSGEDRSRSSDQELKKQQQLAVVGFFEKKTGKRLSSSSMDSSFSSELAMPPPPARDAINKSVGAVTAVPMDWRNRSPSPQKLESMTTRGVGSGVGSGGVVGKKTSSSFSRDVAPPYGIDPSSREARRSSSGSSYDNFPSSPLPEELLPGPQQGELSSPPLLDMSKEGGTPGNHSRPTSFIHPPGAEYSPPPHPWREQGGQRNSGDQSDELHRRLSSSTDVDPSQTHPKHAEALTSASAVTASSRDQHMDGPPGYQVTMNKTYSEEEDSPPSLPPRNYRSPQSPENNGAPQPVTATTPAGIRPGGGGPVPKFNVDATPKQDLYSDQLRKISQSHMSLYPAKYQSKRVPDMPKSSVSVSRPVEAPPVLQEAKVPQSMYRSSNMAKDLNYAGLSDSSNSLDTSKSPQALSSPDRLGSFDNSAVTSPQSPPDHPHHHHPITHPQAGPVHPHHQPPPHHPHQQQLHQTPIHMHQDRTLVDSSFGEDSPSSVPHPSALAGERGPQQSVVRPSTLLPPSTSSPMSASYSSDCYMYNRATTRQGFGGNYKRGSGDITPSPTRVPQSPNFPQGPQQDVSVAPAESTTSASSSSSSVTESYSGSNLSASSSVRSERFAVNDMSSNSSMASRSPMLPKPYLNPPWEPGSRKFYPAASGVVVSSPNRGSKPNSPVLSSYQSGGEGGMGNQDTSPITATPVTVVHQNSHSPNFPNRGPAPRVSPKPSPAVSRTSIDRDTDVVESADVTDSPPSVRSHVVSFEHKQVETMSPKLPRKTHVTRSKVAEMRENLIRRSTENLVEAFEKESNSSRSNESLSAGAEFGSPNPAVVENGSRLNKTPSQEKLVSKKWSPPKEMRLPSTSPSNSQSNSSVDLSYSLPPSSQSSSNSLNGHTSLPNQELPDTPSQYQPDTSPSPCPSDSPPSLPTVAPPALPPKQRKSPPHNSRHKSPKSGKKSKSKAASPAPVDASPPTKSPLSGHVRQKSQEEIDYEKQAEILALQLREEERQLCEVILPPPEHKMSSDYMSGLFKDAKGPVQRRPSMLRIQQQTTVDDVSDVDSSYWSKESSTTELGESSNTIVRQKVELVQRLERKLQILKETRKSVQLEIEENNCLGNKVTEVVEQKVQAPNELDKYQLYVDELDKVMYLLLKLSARLARADNAIKSLPASAPDKERSVLSYKRDELSEKHEDATVLKEGIDRRSNQVALYLRKSLTGEEFEDYEYFIQTKTKLTMDLQEIEDKINLGEEQLSALKKSLNETSA